MNIPLVILLLLALYLAWKYWALLIGAGYDPTPLDKVYKLLDLAKVTRDDVIYDLGSGDGRILLAAAERYGCRVVGIEADPLRFFLSWLRIRQSGYASLITLKLGNFFKLPLGEATLVVIFLYKTANSRLREKFVEDLSPGTRIVSYIWKIPEWEEAGSLASDEIYLYRLKK